MRAVFDTNILIDFLLGATEAKAELGRFADRAISIVTWAEVLVGAKAGDETETRAFLALFAVLDLDRRIAEAAVVLRRERRIRLPDAIVWATATTSGALLVTRNTKDFPADDPAIRIPYRRGGAA